MKLQKNNMKHILTLFFIGFYFCGFSQNSTIKFIKSDVKIDGQLDEPVWNQLPKYTGFYNYAPNDEGLAEQQTEVKLFHNGEHLYVSVVYLDTEEKSQVGSLKRDVPIGLSDGFAMVLDTQNQEQNAYYFSVNAEGTQIDGIVEKINGGYDFSISWNAVWEAKTSTEGNNKIYEVAIPLKFLNFNAENAVFGIQFYVRDIKKNSWTILKNVKRNYRLFDLRFTEKFSVEDLPNKATSKFAITPSVTVNYQEDVANNTGSGFDNLDPVTPTTTFPTVTTLGGMRQQVLCQALSDLSTFLGQAPGTSITTTVRIKIPVSGDFNGSKTGEGSSYYVVPRGTTASMLDGEVWKTINLGFDSWATMPPNTFLSIFLVPTNTTGDFFHGYLLMTYQKLVQPVLIF